MGDLRRLVPATAKDIEEILDLLDRAKKIATEDGAIAAMIVLTTKTANGERTRVTFFGGANTLLASAARAAYEVNRKIDDDA